MIPTSFSPQGFLFDIDGTLVDQNKMWVPANLHLVEDLVIAGRICGVCTGRQWAAIHRSILSHFAPEAWHIVAGGGEIVTTKGRVIWQQALESNLARHIVEQAMHLGSQVIYGEGDVMYGSGPMVLRLERHPWPMTVRPILPAVPIHTAILAIIDLNDATTKFLQQVPGITTKFMVSSQGQPYCDVTAAGVTKGAAVARWCAGQGLAPAAILAAGDGLNDEEVLQAVGCGVAMGHAHPQIKQIADVVLPPEPTALAQFINQWL